MLEHPKWTISRRQKKSKLTYLCQWLHLNMNFLDPQRLYVILEDIVQALCESVENKA